MVGLSDEERGLISKRTGTEWRAYSAKGAGLMASLQQSFFCIKESLKLRDWFRYPFTKLCAFHLMFFPKYYGMFLLSFHLFALQLS